MPHGVLRIRKPLIVGVLAASMLAAIGCGADDEQSADRPAASSIISVPDVAPAKQAEQMIGAIYGTQLAVWTAKHTREWGSPPGTTWAAEKKNDGDWLATFVLTGPKGQRVAAEWTLIDTPLDPEPTPDEIANDDADDTVKPANAAAARIAKLPVERR